MIRAGLVILVLAMAHAYGVMDGLNDDEVLAAHVAQRSAVIAERQEDLKRDTKWAELHLNADEVWSAKVARK